MRDEAVAALHLGDDEVSRQAPIEAVSAVLLHAFERGSQFRLSECGAGSQP